MRRLITILALLLAAECAVAQSPKSVLKAIVGGDILKSTNKFEKISDRTRAKMPEMCVLAEAALLNMPRQAGADKLRGYEMYVNNIEAIRNSKSLDKLFSGLDITFADIVAHIENGSCDYVVALDDERSYVLYLNTARRGQHARLEELEQRLESCRYRNALGGRSIEECSYFLATYPQSQYYVEVASHLALLRYEEAMTSTDEGVMERFIADYSEYEGVDKVANRLMQHRYDRIFSTDSLEDMKWFVATYHEHTDMDSIKQMMADIEFPMLQSTCEALEAFIDYYPYVSQIAEVRVRLQRANIIEKGSVADFVAYVKCSGYDSFYPEMVRHIYVHSKRYIITPDIADATLLRFADEHGMAGYMDLEGNVVIEPQYSCSYPSLGYNYYDVAMLTEFTTYRNVAAIKLNDSWGVINSEGDIVVPHRYQMVTICGSDIYAIADLDRRAVTEMDDSESAETGYFCDVYNYAGELVKQNYIVFFPNSNLSWGYRQFYTNDGRAVGNYLTRNYAIARYNDDIKLVDKQGKETLVGWESNEGVTDDIVVIDLDENGMSGRYYVDLSELQAIKPCPWERVYPMSCGRAMVYDGKKYGFIDENLELVIPCKYDRSHSVEFNCGVIPVSDGSNCFLINTDGEVVSDSYSLIFDAMAYNSGRFGSRGIFVLSLDGQRSYRVIDATGFILAEVESSYPPRIVGTTIVGSEMQSVLFDFDLKQ